MKRATTAWLGLIALAVLFGAGCSTRQPDGPGAQPEVTRSLGAFSGRFHLQLTDVKGERWTLTLVVRRDRTQRIAASVRKADVDVAFVVLDGNRLQCWLPRSGTGAGVRYDGAADHADLPKLFRHLPVLASEIGEGPVPEQPLLVNSEWTLPMGALRAQLTTDNAGRVLSKTISDAHGVVLRLNYAPMIDIAGVQRPSSVTITPNDGTTIIVQPTDSDNALEAKIDIAERVFRLHEDAADARLVDAVGLLRAFETME